MVEYTREQAEQVLKDYKKWLLNAPNEDVNRWHEIFLNHKFPKIEVGKWYKCEAGCIFLTSFEDNKVRFYGVMFDDWHISEMSENKFKLLKFELATDEEIVETLTNEAKKRYNVGDVVRCLHTSFEHTIDSTIYEKWLDYLIKEARVWGSKIEIENTVTTPILLMKEGKWAEVVEQEVYSIGDRFEIDGDKLLLVCTMENHVALICVHTGRRLEKAVRVEQIEKVTQKEFRSIFPTEELFNRVTKIK